jgi:hypothetical protein
MAVGPSELLLVGMLGLLGAVAFMSLLIALLAGIWLSVTPLLAEGGRAVQRRRWRDWHPPTTWLPDAAAVQPEPDRPLWPPRVRGVTYLPLQAGEDPTGPTADARCAPGSHGQSVVGLVAAQVACAQRPTGPTYEPMTMLHARTAHHTTLDLPTRAGCSTLVYVLAGEGAVGDGGRPVQAGETAVFPAGPLDVAARTAAGAPALEMLVLDKVPTVTARQAAPVPETAAPAVRRSRAAAWFGRFHRHRATPA